MKGRGPRRKRKSPARVPSALDAGKKPDAGDPQDTTYRVAKLRAGSVVDRLEAGTALVCLGLLGGPGEGVVTVGVNLPSARLGRKDILKLENRVLTPAEVARVALFGPNATVSIIENFRVVRKITLQLPEVLDGIISCPNPSCITHHDPVIARVRVELRSPLRLRCHYCERRIRRDEIRLL